MESTMHESGTAVSVRLNETSKVMYLTSSTNWSSQDRRSSVKVSRRTKTIFRSHMRAAKEVNIAFRYLCATARTRRNRCVVPMRIWRTSSFTITGIECTSTCPDSWVRNVLISYEQSVRYQLSIIRGIEHDLQLTLSAMASRQGATVLSLIDSLQKYCSMTDARFALVLNSSKSWVARRKVTCGKVRARISFIRLGRYSINKALCFWRTCVVFF